VPVQQHRPVERSTVMMLAFVVAIVALPVLAFLTRASLVH
jgi:hypothetical protein